jgi:hypothetical protein
VISGADDACAATGGEIGNATIMTRAQTAIGESRPTTFAASGRAVETCAVVFDFMVISWLLVWVFRSMTGCWRPAPRSERSESLRTGR